MEEVRRRSMSMTMSKWNPPEVTGPEMITAVLDRVGYRSPGGCGLVDPPEVLYPGVDKSGLQGMSEKCAERVGATSSAQCPPPHYKLGPSGGRSWVKSITLGKPATDPILEEVCCRLEAEGWANPSREEMVRRGSYAVHHWVHTWLDGPDARWGSRACPHPSCHGVRTEKNVGTSNKLCAC